MREDNLVLNAELGKAMRANPRQGRRPIKPVVYKVVFPCGFTQTVATVGVVAAVFRAEREHRYVHSDTACALMPPSQVWMDVTESLIRETNNLKRRLN